MTVGEHQGLGLVPKGLRSGSKLILKVGRAGSSAAGAGPTTSSEEAGQAKGAQPQTQGIRHPHGIEAGLKSSWEDKLTGQSQDQALAWLQCSCNVAQAGPHARASA